MGVSRFIAHQLGRPSRLTGRILDLVNARINRHAIELLEVEPEHRVLDVGFGGGIALRKLARPAGFSAGVDHSAAAVDAARVRLRDEIEAGRVEVEEASVEATPFEDASFDRVLSVNAIYFWPDPARGLAEIARVTKPGGRLVLATEQRPTPERIAKHGFRFHSDEERADLVRGAGFARVRIEPWKAFTFVVAERD